jgi:hypothetical protein
MNAPVEKEPSSSSLVPVIGLAILNGIFSPQLIAVFALQGLWFPFFLPASVSLTFALSSLLLATVYLMASGIPAALFEKFFGSGKSSFSSRLIWFSAMALMTIPSLPNIMRQLGLA